MSKAKRSKINFKLYLFVIVICFITMAGNAQHSGLNFQAVARNSTGVIIASQQISLRFSILPLSSNGTAEYIETRILTTNAQGIFSIVIGDGTATVNLGSYATIDWKTMPKFLKVELDPSGGNNFTVMGTTQLQTVPYANYSQYSANAGSVDGANISGFVPVARGGTGASSLVDFKANLQLDNVNNTSDLSKPISTLTQTALGLKLNFGDSLVNYITPTQFKKSQFDSSYLSTRIDEKANITFVANALLEKENSNNKSTAIGLGGSVPSDILYPTQKAVKNYVDTTIYKIEKLTSFNGLIIPSQHLEISNQGNKPAIISKDSIHTINLPIASNPLVTAGLITKVDYDQFYNKSDFSGNYNDLANKPIIPAKQIQSNWIESDTSKVDFVKNKPILSTLANTGSYFDLKDQPTAFDLGAAPSTRSITINGLTQDLSVDRSWVVNPVIGSVSMETDVKDILSITNGGTGTAVKNFVDLNTSQIINGEKTLIGKLSVGASSSEENAIVDMISNSKGFLPPRLSTAQRDAIVNPPVGLTIFNTDRNCLEWWIGSIWYNACGNVAISTTTNGSANVTIIDCATGYANGTLGASFDIGVPINSSNSWQVLNLKVNTIGNYNFTATANGITYSAVGQFYSSDVSAPTKEILMYASGAAQNAGTFTYKLATVPSCAFTNSVNRTSSNGSSVIDAWDNTNEEYGTLIQGTTISNVNQKIRASVPTTTGTYKILASQNGITFSTEGNFATANALHDVVLTASGIPTNAGTFTFTTNTTPSKTFTRTVISPSSNGTAVIRSWVVNVNDEGVLTASNQIISNTLTQTITADVIVPGTYFISAISNGITFSGSGIFTGTGSQTINLVASGTPTNIGNTNFNINTNPSASFDRTVLLNPTSGGTSVVTSWTNESSFGSMTVGNVVNYVSNTVNAFVDKIGTYEISAINNGVLFYASGTFTTRGYQKVVLNASGNPTTIGNTSFTLNVSSPCSFLRYVSPNSSTNGTAIINNWSGGTSAGNLYVNKVAIGFTFIVNADVTRVGTYALDIITYGITFTATGTFTSTGTNAVTFVASGTPNAITSIRLLLTSVTNLYSTPAITVNANPSSNGTSNIGSWSLGAQNGIGYVGEVVENLSQELIANVLTIGTYSISNTLNGVTFSSSGTFAGTGSQTVKLTASGTPVNLWNSINTTNTTPSKTFLVQYYSKSTNGTAVVSSWTNGSLSKSIYTGASLYQVNYTLIANVSSIGTYNISAVNNGITFYSTGTFTSTGLTTVTLTAFGLPDVSGTYPYLINTLPNTTFNVDVFSRTSNGTSVLKDLKFGTSVGTLYYGLSANNVSKEIKVTVTKIGTYDIDTETATGVEFSASGTFTSLGEKTITLNASGIPTSHLYSIFTLSNIAAAAGFSNNFSFNIEIPPVGTRLDNNGGIIAYIYKPEDIGYDANLPHGIIAARNDLSTGIVWENDINNSVGDTYLELGTGYANSSVIFSRSTVMNAALISLNYNSGYNNGMPEDWHLPSHDELYKLYINRIAIGGFSQRYYWSSSELNESMAIARDFSTVYLVGKIKNSLLAVRPVRPF